MKFETLTVHAGRTIDPSGGVVPSLQLSTTFERDAEGVPIGGHTYIRESNPNQTQLEAALAPLEGAEAALVFASGMAAGAALLQTLRPETRLVWLETPSNPLLQVVDLAAASALARAAGALTVVDNTFATPVLQQPLALGADVSLHSTTKYFGGHSDVQGGALLFARRDDLYDRAEHARHILGAVASPFNCWLVLRGLRTLACRVTAQSAGGLAVARAAEAMPEIAAVHYPGLPSHPGHAIAARQMSGFGGMLSLRVAAGREAALRAVSRVRLFTRATSLGGVESLLEHRATSEGPTSRTPQDLLRLSVGLEHPDDLIEDLRQALAV